MARTQKNAQILTTAQRLSSIVKSCRDIMRKDKGLNGDLDRLPMLTWIMFLKFLDDMEQIAEQEAKMSGKRFRPALEAPYRWRDWAAKADGITGDELIAFVNNEEAVRSDGKKGPGLFAYLRGFQGANGGDRRDVIATVFKGDDQPDDQRLPAARRDQQSQRHSLHQQRRDSYSWSSVRIDAQRNARRRRRLRRVLYSARRRSLYR